MNSNKTLHYNVIEKKYLLVITSVITAIGVALIIFFNHNKTMCQDTSDNKKDYNGLKNEKSPYLIQHADNPVNWYAWSDEAFQRAKQDDKPIFLSIGYSTCHWCHVMEDESFEDTAVARLMNDAFVSIKVDREERPDIDNIYMSVCQAITGGGGWPLTIIMTPDKKPFFAGTYIPREGRMGSMGMIELISKVKQAWKNQRTELEKSGDEITNFVKNLSVNAPGDAPDITTLEFAFNKFKETYDKENGGFGKTIKFPTPHNFLFLLRYWNRSGDKMPLEIVDKTLNQIRQGGIYDHIGFGFHRYSTDAQWLVPHFEKMLYDQALLSIAYTEAYQVTGKEIYKKTATEILTYVLRDMTSPDGGFYSAEDADSEGREGKFYLWTEDEIRNVIGNNEEADFFVKVFNVKKEGNFNETKGEATKNNILHLSKSYSELASELNTSEQELMQRIENDRRKLFDYREKRIHPRKDDKILTDWNGLMIVALSKAARVFGEPKYEEASKRAMEFILKNLRKDDGRLLHRYRDGQSVIQASIDDYAFTVWALIELYETTFEVNYLKTAIDLNKDMLVHFWDKNGGFYFSADDGEKLLVRSKEYYDGAIPSGNSVAMLNLLRLGRITMNSELEKNASQIAQSISKNVKSSPQGYSMLLTALDYLLGPSYEIVISGNSKADDTKEMIAKLNRLFVPNKILLLRPDELESPEIVTIAKYTKEQLSIGKKSTAYICKNYACNLPTTDINQMMKLLKVK